MSIKKIQTAHLVHDLKNPVNIIETGARSLLEKRDRYGTLNPRQEKVVRRLLRNALKIKNLVYSMLEVDKAAIGVIKATDSTMSEILKNALVEVFDVVDPSVSDALHEATTFEKLRSVLRAQEVILEGDEAHFNRRIQIDEIKMSLIITNLLSNAFKYKHRSVHLKCMADGDSVNVSVRDDGPGIPECYHEQIFDQYFQCLKAEEFPVRGHGLGLAGAQALAEALGGQLSLGKSRQGAEFMVSIKLKPSR